MPTLTFYVTDEVAEKLEMVIAKRTRTTGIKVSRGDIIIPHIKKLYEREFPANGHTKPAPAAVEVNEEEKQ